MIQATANGRLGRDAEKRTVGDTSVVSFPLAVDKPKKQGEEQQSDWYQIEMWGKRGEALAPYLLKGTKLVVQGRLELQNFVKNNGEPGFKAVINANDIELIARPANAAPAQQQQAAPVPQQRQPVAATAPSRANDIDAIFASEDEIPF